MRIKHLFFMAVTAAFAFTACEDPIDGDNENGGADGGANFWATYQLAPKGVKSITYNGNTENYDSNGRLVKKYDYSEKSLTISDLKDGNYTLVTMAGSQFFNSIYTIGQFTESGLRQGVDYMKNNVAVKSGKMTISEKTNIKQLYNSWKDLSGVDPKIDTLVDECLKITPVPDD